jgi:hypothetical protein
MGTALTEIETCSPTVYTGLHGDLTVTKAGRLGDVEIFHFDDRATMSIISASDILKQGHMWEFDQGRSIDTDAFLVHTPKFTNGFQHRDGLYVSDLANTPELRHLSAILRRIGSAHPTIVLTPKL